MYNAFKLNVLLPPVKQAMSNANGSLVFIVRSLISRVHESMALPGQLAVIYEMLLVGLSAPKYYRPNMIHFTNFAVLGHQSSSYPIV